MESKKKKMIERNLSSGFKPYFCLKEFIYSFSLRVSQNAIVNVIFEFKKNWDNGHEYNFWNLIK